jgi:hypothetical protein
LRISTIASEFGSLSIFAMGLTNVELRIEFIEVLNAVIKLTSILFPTGTAVPKFVTTLVGHGLVGEGALGPLFATKLARLDCSLLIAVLNSFT